MIMKNWLLFGNQAGLVAMAIHMLATLMEEGFKTNVLPWVFGTIHHQVENWQIMVMAQSVEEHAGNSPRHTSERYNIDNPIEAMLSVFHCPPHTQNSLSLYCRV